MLNCADIQFYRLKLKPISIPWSERCFNEITFWVCPIKLCEAWRTFLFVLSSQIFCAKLFWLYYTETMSHHVHERTKGVLKGAPWTNERIFTNGMLIVLTRRASLIPLGIIFLCCESFWRPTWIFGITVEDSFVAADTLSANQKQKIIFSIQQSAPLMMRRRTWDSRSNTETPT